MKKHGELSDPITLRLPNDLLEQVELIAKACGRTRSWVMVRAMRSYVAGEGDELLAIATAERELDDGNGRDLDAVLDEMGSIVRGNAA